MTEQQAVPPLKHAALLEPTTAPKAAEVVYAAVPQGESPSGAVASFAAVEPTQVRRPWRATARTAFQTALVVIPLLALIVPQAIQVILDESGDALPEHFRTFLLGVSAVVVALAAIVARIMAIPAVEVLLRKYLPGLAAAPRSESLEG